MLCVGKGGPYLCGDAQHFVADKIDGVACSIYSACQHFHGACLHVDVAAGACLSRCEPLVHRRWYNSHGNSILQYQVVCHANKDVRFRTHPLLIGRCLYRLRGADLIVVGPTPTKATHKREIKHVPLFHRVDATSLCATSPSGNEHQTRIVVRPGSTFQFHVKSRLTIQVGGIGIAHLCTRLQIGMALAAWRVAQNVKKMRTSCCHDASPFAFGGGRHDIRLQGGDVVIGTIIK